MPTNIGVIVELILNMSNGEQHRWRINQAYCYGYSHVWLEPADIELTGDMNRKKDNLRAVEVGADELHESLVKLHKEHMGNGGKT